MALDSTQLLSVARRWFSPTTVTVICSLAIVGWIGWIGYQSWVDRPLPTSAISAHEYRLNTAQLKSLDDRLQSYHQPTDSVTVNPDIFTLPSS